MENIKKIEGFISKLSNYTAILSFVGLVILMILNVLDVIMSKLTGNAILGAYEISEIILMVTVFGIGFSFNKKIRNTPNSFNTGQYLIYMFSFAIGISFSLEHVNLQIIPLLSFFAFVQFGSLILHFILSKLANIDGNISVITSTAGIYGPAFVVPVANALKDKNAILPGIICGIVGYAIGNFLGIGLALFLGLL